MHLTGEAGYALALFTYYYLGYGALTIPLSWLSVHCIICLCQALLEGNALRLGFDGLLTSISGLTLRVLGPPMPFAGIAPGGYAGYPMQRFLLSHFEWLGSIILLTGMGLMGCTALLFLPIGQRRRWDLEFCFCFVLVSFCSSTCLACQGYGSLCKNRRIFKEESVEGVKRMPLKTIRIPHCLLGAPPAEVCEKRE